MSQLAAIRTVIQQACLDAGLGFDSVKFRGGVGGTLLQIKVAGDLPDELRARLRAAIDDHAMGMLVFEIVTEAEAKVARSGFLR